MSKEHIIPAGIGDALWILQTLPQDEAHSFVICKSNKYRAWQLLDLVPSLVDKYREAKNIKFAYDNPAITQANRHLENGNRLEEFTGQCTWELPLQTSQYKAQAGKLMRKPRGKKVIGVYTSTLRHSWVQRGQAWAKEEWVKLLRILDKNGYKVALFGAEYDADMRDYLKGEGLQFFDIVGDQHLGATIECMKKCEGFIGFPSGLPILAHLLELPTIMFFPHEPRHLKMHNTFNRPGSIEDGTWKGCGFPKIEELQAWAQGNEFWRGVLC